MVSTQALISLQKAWWLCLVAYNKKADYLARVQRPRNLTGVIAGLHYLKFLLDYIQFSNISVLLSTMNALNVL